MLQSTPWCFPPRPTVFKLPPRFEMSRRMLFPSPVRRGRAAAFPFPGALGEGRSVSLPRYSGGGPGWGLGRQRGSVIAARIPGALSMESPIAPSARRGNRRMRTPPSPPFVRGGVAFVTHTHYPSPIIRHSPLITHHSSLITHYSSLITSSSRPLACARGSDHRAQGPELTADRRPS
jgi:hypothetical protein